MLSSLIARGSSRHVKGRVFNITRHVNSRVYHGKNLMDHGAEIEFLTHKNNRRCSFFSPSTSKPKRPDLESIFHDINLSQTEIHPTKPERNNNHQQNCRLSPAEQELKTSLKNLSNGNPDLKSLELISLSKVLLLLEKANNYMRGAFINTWDSAENPKWENTEENRNRFIEKIGLCFLNFDSYQQMVISTRNIDTWYSTILIKSLKILDAQVPFDVLNELDTIRNNMCDETYYELWRQISILLLELNVPTKEIDEYKPSIISQSAQPLSQKLDLQFKVFKDWGERASKEGLLNESIEYYSKAIHTPGISYDELCKLYYARSAVHRQCNDNSSAERDARCALYFSGLVQKVKN